MEFGIEGLKEIISKVVSKRPEIDAVYLFGSVLRGKKSRSSDIDIAFLFNRNFYKKDPLKAFFEAEMLGFEIGEECQKEIDVSLLNEASLPFAYEVITTGSCMYEKDHGERLLYEIVVKGRFYDFKPFLKRLREKRLKEALSEAL